MVRTPSRSPPAVARTALAAALLAPAACAPPLINQPSMQVPAPPQQVARSAGSVFHRFNIPVAHHETEAGTLRSGPFVVDGTWGGEPVEERVHCGWNPDGQPRAIEAPIRLNVRMRARSRQMTTEDPQRPVTMGSRIEVDGSGVLMVRGEEVRCTLTRDFMWEVVEAIAVLNGGGERRPGLPLRRAGEDRTPLSAPVVGPRQKDWGNLGPAPGSSRATGILPPTFP